jgi:PAS domain S-box-containing protein
MKKFLDNTGTETFLETPVVHNGDDFLQSYCDVISRSLGADYVSITLRDASNSNDTGDYCAPSFSSKREAFKSLLTCRSDGSLWFRDSTQINSDLIANDLDRARLPKDMAHSLRSLGIKSFGLFLIRSNGARIGAVVCAFASQFHRWRADEIAELTNFGADVKEQQGPVDVAKDVESTVLGAKLSEYQRLAGHGNIVMLHTDNRFRVIDVFGNSLALVGLPKEALIGDAGIWDKIVDRRDRALLRQRIRQIRAKKGELCEELRIIHGKTGEVRWLHLRALPQFSAENDFLGWEGFGVDVTERREAQVAAIDKSRRLEALIDVSHILVESHSSNQLLLTGLGKLLSAVGAESGYACLYDANTKQVEIVVTSGFTQKFVNRLEEVCTGASLLRRAVEEKQAFLLEDIQSDNRAVKHIAQIEGLRSMIISPMVVGGEVYGAMVACKRSAGAFKQDDFDMFQAGTMQVGIGLKQLELIENHKRHRRSAESLFNITKSLSKSLPITEMIDVVLPLLRSEFGIHTAWLGLMEDREESIIGRSGAGDCFRSREAIEIRLQVDSNHPPLLKAVQEQRPVFWKQRLDAPQIQSVIPGASKLIYVPMISVGKIIGILVAEPSSVATFKNRDSIKLLSSIANELATAILLGRYEIRVAESHTMRMAALLSGGVAHNFNNLLQVILGQSSVLEIKGGDNPSISAASKVITEAARKGATLVEQLANVASQTPLRKSEYKATNLIGSLVDNYLSTKSQNLICNYHSNISEEAVLQINARQLEHVLNNILRNAEESFEPNSMDRRIQISTHELYLRVGQVSAELPPGAYIRIDVADNGSGMNYEQRSRCFEPFFTTKQVDPGSGVSLTGAGLGLATSYHIIKAHGGIMTIRSGAGAGTICSVYLPKITKLHDASVSGDTVRSTVSKEEVLLVNLHPSIFGSVLSALDSLQIPNQGTFDVSQALEVLSSSMLSVNRVIIDADVYGDAIEGVVETLLGASKNVHILVIGETETALQKVQKQARVFLRRKPISIHSLEGFIRSSQEPSKKNVAAKKLPK